MSHDWFVLLCGALIGFGVATLVFTFVLWRIRRDMRKLGY